MFQFSTLTTVLHRLASFKGVQIIYKETNIEIIIVKDGYYKMGIAT